MNQLLPIQRAQYVTFTSPTEKFALNWSWMHRVRLQLSDNQLRIIFPSLVVLVRGTKLSDLLGQIAIGNITHISQIELNETERQTVRHWHVAGVEFSDPDEDGNGW